MLAGSAVLEDPLASLDPPWFVSVTWPEVAPVGVGVLAVLTAP